MKEILYFYLNGCPFCKKADEYISELIAENSDFAHIRITKVEERQNSKLAKCYNYFYVPCLWIGDKKIHEGVPTKDNIRACLIAALDENSVGI